MKKLTLYHIIPMLVATVLATVVYYEKFGILEGELLPVVTDLTIIDENVTHDGTVFYLSFNKRRNCEFIDINWYKDGKRFLVDFDDTILGFSQSRSTGPQFAGPWILPNLDELKGSTAEVRHQCHPLWKTITKFYPPKGHGNG